MKYLFLISLLMVSGCGVFQKKGVEPKDPVTPSEPELLEKVRERRDQYCALSSELFAERNYIVNKCDGLLFAALHKLSCGYPELAPWQGDDGQWFRSMEHDCFIPPDTDNGANAQGSKDMVAGMELEAVVTGNQARIEAFVNRTQGNNWFFCEAIDAVTLSSKCWLPPTTYKRMADFSGLQLRERTDKKKLKLADNEFTHHLETITVLSEGRVYGGITKTSLNKLESNAERQNRNVLYLASKSRYTDGDMTEAATLWLEQCPANRLPNSHDDWCSDYRNQRNQDNSGDWKPCKEEPKVIHFGTDCSFAASVMLGEI